MRCSMVRIANILTIALLLATAGWRTAAAAEVSLVGKPCPALALKEYMLQGEPVTQARFAGKVVWLDLFQVGCPGCEQVSMPHLQTLWEQFQNHPDCVILALNTAFEKEQYPFMADEENTKKHLKEMGWNFPVARDADEKTAPMLQRSIPGGRVSYGTPMAVVIGPDGTVLAHEWAIDEASLGRLMQAFEDALEDLSFPLPGAVDDVYTDALQHLKNRRFGDARVLAAAIAASSAGAVKTDGEYLVKFIDDCVQRKIDAVTKQFAADPDAGIAAAGALVKKFSGVPLADAFAATAAAWPEHETVKAAREQKSRLDQLLAEIEREGYFLAKERGTELAVQLRALAETATPKVAAAAREQAGALDSSFAKPGFIGIVPAQNQPATGGVAIHDVLDAGPAFLARLQAGDVIKKIGGTDIASLQEFMQFMSGTHPGDSVEVVFEREGQAQTVTVRLGRRMQ